MERRINKRLIKNKQLKLQQKPEVFIIYPMMPSDYDSSSQEALKTFESNIVQNYFGNNGNINK